jgi:hypothetical protein
VNKRELLPPQIIFTPRKRKKEKRKKKKIKDILFKQPEKWRLSRFFGRILPEVKRGVEIVAKTRSARPLLTVNVTAIFVYSFFLAVNILLKKSLFSLGFYFGIVFFVGL